MQLVAGGGVDHLVADLRHELRLGGADDGCGTGRLVRRRRVALLQLAREGELRGVGVRDRDFRDRAVGLDDVHDAPVGHVPGGELRHFRERLAIVERPGQGIARRDDERTLIFDQLAVVDVGRGADPERDRAVLVPNRNRPSEVPAVLAAGAQEPVLDLEGLAREERLLAACDRGRQVVGMHDEMPRVRPGVGQRHARVLEPAPVEVRRGTGDVGRPDDLRHRIRELAVALLAGTLERCELLRVQLLGLHLQLPVLLPELDEDGNLGAEDVRLDRLEDVVDRTSRVAAEDVPLLLRQRGDEDDRDVLRALAPLDQLGELEPVELGHLDVEQQTGEVVEEQLLQSRRCPT